MKNSNKLIKTKCMSINANSWWVTAKWGFIKKWIVCFSSNDCVWRSRIIQKNRFITNTNVNRVCGYGSRYSFVKPSIELTVVSAFFAFLQFLAIWPFSLQLKRFLRAKQLLTKWPGFWQLLRNGLLFREVFPSGFQV